jgi:hypothetical protein
MTDTAQTEGPVIDARDASSESPGQDQLNDQIRDAVSQLQALLSGADRSSVRAAAYQAFAHVIALAMHNAVAEQQHGHILRMALTTSAANAILAGRKAEAEGILELARSKLVSPDLSDLLSNIRACVETMSRELNRIDPIDNRGAASAAGAPG